MLNFFACPRSARVELRTRREWWTAGGVKELCYFYYENVVVVNVVVSLNCIVIVLGIVNHCKVCK